MTVHIARDYSSAPSGYVGSKFFTSFPYNLAIFLHKILGYNIVGSWGFNIDSPARSLTISAASSAATSIITATTSTPHGLSNGDAVYITGGTGLGGINGNFMVSVINSTQVYLLQSLGNGAAYGANSATMQTGYLYANGTPGGNTGANINIPGASSPYAVSIPFSQRAVTASDIGKPLVLKSTSYPTKNSGIFKIASLNQGNTTTIAALSNGVSLPTGTINVASTSTFPASGTIYVVTSNGTQQVTYTGTSGGNQFTGCLGGTGTMSTGNLVSNLNAYNVDYRSSDTPPPENSAAGPLSWWLYEIETQVSQYIQFQTPQINLNITGATNTTPITITGGNNPSWATGQQATITGGTGNLGVNGTWTITQVTGTNNQFILNGSAGTGTYNSSTAQGNIIGYFGDGYSLNSRILLQSPHASGWQVRICVEPASGAYSLTSVSTGLGGNSFGDFPIGGITNYIPLFLNISPSGGYVNTSMGGGAYSTASRYTFVGDDGGQAVVMYSRTLGSTNNGLMVLGVPDNEPNPVAPASDRPFVYAGINPNSDFGQIVARIGNGLNCGFAYRSGIPELVALTSWGTVQGQNNGYQGIIANSFFYSTNATDSPFTGTTEVMPFEVWGGVLTDTNLAIPQPSGGAVIFQFNQRFMGTAPFLRNGRTNFGNFALSTDNITTLSVLSTSGNGVSPIQVQTTTTNALTTGQTVVISGVNGNTAANGTFQITVVNNTTFNLNGTTGNGTYTTGGTVNGTPHWLHLQNGIYLLWNGCAGLTP